MDYLIKYKPFKSGCLMYNYSTVNVRERVEDRIVFWNS